jgi:hypothetical protein
MSTTLWNTSHTVPGPVLARAVARRLIVWSGVAAAIVVANAVLLLALLWAVSIIE